MILKILDKKTRIEKEFPKIKKGDIVYFTCTNCNKKSKKAYYKYKKNITKYIHICSKCLTKATFLKKYGVESYSQTKEFKNKIKQIFLKKYGVDNYSKTKEFKVKSKNTFLKNYGVSNPFKSEKIKKKIKYSNLNNHGGKWNSQTKNWKIKYEQTCLKRYGKKYYQGSEQSKLDYLVKYNEETPMRASKVKEKKYLTTKKNNSFHTSKPEEKVYKILLGKFIDVKRQYKEDRYPFVCDFYIPEKDLFIECNFHWTHGKEPFDNHNKEHMYIINKWLNKNTKYYKQAIKTWTERDIEKRLIAIKNNLKYIELFNIKEVINI